MKEKSRSKRRIGLAIIALGLGFLLYPLTSILYNTLMGEFRIEEFRRQESEISLGKRAEQLSQAQSYNEKLDGSTYGVVDPFDVKNYSTLNPLDYGEGQVFGYISIPKIDEKLPIYLGASEYHLSIGVAQVDGTDLPVGGVNTRSVIAGHRGYTT
ncbi:MAG: sortase, partial [Gallicola sp.]|nr:sortase [Gallicola sp.]